MSLMTTTGKISHLQLSDGLRAQFLVGDHLAAVIRRAKQRAGAAGGAQINGLVTLQRLADRLVARALADHALEAQVEQLGRVGVHAARGGRTRRADHLSGPCGVGPTK